MSFTDFNFNTQISKGLSNHGYLAPTLIQKKAIQPILDGRDLLGLAQTGPGFSAVADHRADQGTGRTDS